MTDHIDTCIVGGGVVGLAIARELAQPTSEVFVLEQADDYGLGVSSRSSEVIHAGIYYQKGSLKSTLCIKGKSVLYEYCSKRKVPHYRCGKLIVAMDELEEEILESIRLTAIQNGVDDLTYWSKDQLSEREPGVQASLALHSPSTGIVSSRELMGAFVADLSNQGGQLVLNTRVESISRIENGFLLNCIIDGKPFDISTRVLVNAAGLGAQSLAGRCDFIKRSDIPELFLCRGRYFAYGGRNPFNHLIYPVPEKTGAGLGVHATIDLGGQLKFGPDVEYVDDEDYSISDDRLDAYYNAAKKYFPGLERDKLLPGYVGIRPKLQGPGDSVRDFCIQSQVDHGVPNYLQLFGMESPGLTSSMAVAEYVSHLLTQ